MWASGEACTKTRYNPTASWATSRASPERPTPDRTEARLFNDPARSGMWASGEACTKTRYNPTASRATSRASPERPTSDNLLARLWR